MKKVVIVGAGPAGLSCAIHLYHLGINDITIINKNNHKIHKACSGFLTEKTYCALKEIDIDAVKDLDYEKANHAITYYNYKKVFEVNKKDIYIYFSKSTARENLDNYMYHIIKDKVNIIENSKIDDISFSDNTIIVDQKKIHYDYLIFADGFMGISSKYNKKQEEEMFGIEIKVKNEKPLPIQAQVYFNVTNDGYAWKFQREDFSTIGLTDRYDKKIDYLALLKEFAKNLGYDIDVKDIKGAFLSSRTRDLIYNKNTFFIGEAAGLTDSITSEGIYYALYSAKQAAIAVQNDNYKLYLKNMKKDVNHLKLSSLYSKIFYNKKIQKKLWCNRSSDKNSFGEYILKKACTSLNFKYKNILKYYFDYKKNT